MVKEFISRIFRGQQPSAFDAVSGGNGQQKIVDPRLLLSAQNFYVGLRREEKLGLYYSVSKNQPLAVGALNVTTRFVNARPIFKSGNHEVDRRAKIIWDNIKGHEVNSQLIRQGNTYGYSVGEIVFPAGEITHVVVPESPMVRFTADQYGQLQGVTQLPGSI